MTFTQRTKFQQLENFYLCLSDYYKGKRREYDTSLIQEDIKDIAQALGVNLFGKDINDIIQEVNEIARGI